MREILDDVRGAVRGAWRRPLYPLVVLTIMALGLTAAVTVFTYFNSYAQPFPGVRADGLVRVFGVTDDDPFQELSYLDFVDYADAAPASFTGMAVAHPYSAASVRHETWTEVAFLTAVSGSFFQVVGTDLALGRAIAPADDRSGAPPVAVISHRWWRRSFQADSAVIGRTLYLNYRPFTIVGVAAPAFRGTTAAFRPDVWIPLAPYRDRYVTWAARAEERDRPLVRVFARLRPGVTRERAEADLRRVAAGLDAQYPLRAGPRAVRLAPATWIEPRTRADELPTIRVMLAAAGGVLLLVAANVANLLLAVAAGRDRDLAMRSALGASPARLLRATLLENVLLSLPAGAVALALAVPLSARLGSYFARPSVWGEHVPRQAALDGHVLLVGVGAALLTGLAAGLLPALRASRRRLAPALTSDAAGGADAPRRWLGHRAPAVQDALVSSQAALAILLLLVAGLTLRTLAAVRRVDPGFAFDHLVASQISTSSTSVTAEERDRFFRTLAQRLREEPWVRGATIADNAPLAPQTTAELRPDDRPDPVRGTVSRVIPGYFETIGIGILDGRAFTVGDTAGAPPVAVINEAMARRFFPDGKAVGRRVWWVGDRSRADRAFEVVGVARDVRVQDLLSPPEPVAYLSYPQHPYPTGSALVVAATGDAAAAVGLLQAWLRRYEPHLAIVNVLPYTEVVRGFLYVQRMNAELFATLAVLGLTLATVGIFSVVTLAVGRRRREIGIRMAIGARGLDVGRMILWRALAPVIAGLAMGVAGAAVLTGLVRSMLHGVHPADPLTLAAGAAVLLLAAVGAALWPARRAAAMHPMTALRTE
jgi:predicted permease